MKLSDRQDSFRLIFPPAGKAVEPLAGAYGPAALIIRSAPGRRPILFLPSVNQIRFTDQGMTLEKDCFGDKQNPDCQPIHYSLKEAQLFQEHLLALHIEYWSPYYNGRAIDGRTWTLDVYYSDGFRAQYQGVSAYPENWNDLLRLLQVKFNEEDDY